MAVEFCPACKNPLPISDRLDPSRLCGRCGWFGDRAEVIMDVPFNVDPATRARQLVAMYRDTCRSEMVAEQMFQQGMFTREQLSHIRQMSEKLTEAMLTALGVCDA